MQEIITWFKNIGDVKILLDIFKKRWWKKAFAITSIDIDTLTDQWLDWFYIENNDYYFYWNVSKLNESYECRKISFTEFIAELSNKERTVETKNSWINNTFEGGAKREDKTNKLRYDLIPTEILDSLALKYWQWAQIYWENNWRKWDEKFAKWCIASAFRHFMQWIKWDTDEDHKASICFNIYAYDILKNNKK